MSTQHGKKAPPASGKRSSAASRRNTSEVQPISPVGLAISIAAALVIAFVLLVVINTRINAARPAAAPATPTQIVAAAGQTTPTIAAQATSSGITQVGGFAKGNPQAKVTVTEFSDFK